MTCATTTTSADLLWHLIRLTTSFMEGHNTTIADHQLVVQDLFDCSVDASLLLCNCSAGQPVQFQLPGMESLGLFMHKLQSSVQQCMINLGRVHFDTACRSVLLADAHWMHVHHDGIQIDHMGTMYVEWNAEWRIVKFQFLTAYVRALLPAEVVDTNARQSVAEETANYRRLLQSMKPFGWPREATEFLLLCRSLAAVGRNIK